MVDLEKWQKLKVGPHGNCLCWNCLCCCCKAAIDIFTAKVEAACSESCYANLDGTLSSSRINVYRVNTQIMEIGACNVIDPKATPYHHYLADDSVYQ